MSPINSILPEGTDFGHYRIVSRLGEGGMGEVYLAEDLTLHRRVAVKFLSKTLSGDRARWEALLNEARLAAAVDNPSVVAVYDAGVYRDTPFVVMELIDGTGFESLSGRAPLPWKEVTSLAEQMCEILKSVHSRGIVHGDIKPSNLMLDRANRVRLLDFGVGRLVQDGSPLPGGDASTSAYAAPEVASGGAPTPGSDLFSLGVVLYELTTGVRPFAGAYHAAVTYSIINENPRPPIELAPDIPESLNSIILQLLEKSPEQRFSDAGAVANSLSTITVGSRPRHIPRLWSRPTLMWLLAVALPVVAIIVWYMSGGRLAMARTPASLAVLPFENLGKPGDDYFADGITDEVTVSLARNRRLRVISQSSTRYYRESDQSTFEIGSELSVDYLLRGTIHWERGGSNRVRINAALIRVEDDAYVWTDSYDRNQEHIFDVYRDVALAVSRALDRVVTADSTSAPTSSLAAYDYYLQGNQYFNRSWERSDIEIASGLYRRAVEADSEFAAAWAMLSRCEASMFWEYFDRAPARCSTAYDAARRCVSLRSDLSDGYLALGYCFYHCDRDYERALAQFDQGLICDPNNAELHNAVGAVRRRQGEFQPAVGSFVRALALDPRSHLKAFDIALTFGMMRQYDSSAQYLERCVALAPDYALAHIYRAWLPIISSGDTEAARRAVADATSVTDLSSSKYYWWLLRIIHEDHETDDVVVTPATDTVAYYLFKAQHARLQDDRVRRILYADSAKAILERCLAAQPDDSRFLSSLGLAYASLGDSRRAVEYAVKAVQLLPSSREAFDAPFLLLNLAEVFVIVGDSDRAVEQLETVLSIPGFASASYLKADPLWVPLRTHPRFVRLLADDTHTP